MNIYESIAAVQADVDFISKDKKVQSGGTYKYRGVDQVLNTLHPLFARHKVFAVPEVLELMFRELRTTKSGGEVVYQALKVRYTFYAEDGSNVSAIVVGEAMDSGDKASNKCMSVAYKYACFQILSIPTEETAADPDDENHQLAPNERDNVGMGGTENVPKSKLTQVTELIEGSAYDLDDVNSLMATKFGRGKSVNELTEDEFASLMKVLKKAIGGRDE